MRRLLLTVLLIMAGCAMLAAQETPVVTPAKPPANDLITPVDSKPITLDEALQRRLKVLARPARNAILLIADGLGAPALRLSRDAIVGRQGKLETDRFPIVGRVIGFAADSTVNDSAAAASTLATGKIGLFNKVSVDAAGNQLITIMDLARNKGMKTGIISDTRLTHATPAAFAGHVNHRDEEAKLAEQIVFSGIDLLMSGGRAWFQSVEQGGKQPKGRNLLADVQQQGYRVVQSRQDLVQALTDKVEKVFAVFSDSFMPFTFEPDCKSTPDLPEMTASALKILSAHPKGFLLMVEAGQIDALSHAHDAAELVEQIREMDATVRVLQEFVRTHPDTLLVMVPDHSTGGLHMTERFQEDTFRKSAVSTKMLARRIAADPASLADELKKSYPSLTFSDAEIASLKLVPAGEEFEMRLGDLVWGKLGISFLDTGKSLHEMATNGHGCEDMFLHAMGTHQTLFQGVMNLSDIPRRIAAALQLGELR